MSSFSQLNWAGSCTKVCLKDIFYCLIALTGQQQAPVAKVENVLNCLLRVHDFPSEWTTELIQNGHTII